MLALLFLSFIFFTFYINYLTRELYYLIFCLNKIYNVNGVYMLKSEYKKYKENEERASIPFSYPILNDCGKVTKLSIGPTES